MPKSQTDNTELTVSEKFRIISEYEKIKLFIPELKVISIRINNKGDNKKIALVIISLINNTVSDIIVFSNDKSTHFVVTKGFFDELKQESLLKDNFILPLRFFEDISQLSYSRYTKEVSYHMKYLNCDEGDGHLTLEQKEYFKHGIRR